MEGSWMSTCSRLPKDRPVLKFLRCRSRSRRRPEATQPHPKKGRCLRFDRQSHDIIVFNAAIVWYSTTFLPLIVVYSSLHLVKREDARPRHESHDVQLLRWSWIESREALDDRPIKWPSRDLSDSRGLVYDAISQSGVRSDLELGLGKLSRPS